MRKRRERERGEKEKEARKRKRREREERGRDGALHTFGLTMPPVPMRIPAIVITNETT
jgi:hypothetical protein